MEIKYLRIVEKVWSHLWVIGFCKFALAQEKLQVSPVHVWQQDHGLLTIFYTDMTDGKQVPEV